MKKLFLPIVLLPASLALMTACSRTSVSNDSKAPGADFEEASAALHEALRTNDTDALFTHIADDVVILPPGEPPVRGKAAMRDWYAGFLSEFRTTSLTLLDREAVAAHGWVYQMGQFEWVFEPVAGGAPLTDYGSYLQVWKLQPDGRWLLTREIWNSSPPPFEEP